eukprot:1884060-Amphidinium_carterae.1
MEKADRSAIFTILPSLGDRANAWTLGTTLGCMAILPHVCWVARAVRGQGAKHCHDAKSEALTQFLKQLNSDNTNH